MRELLPPERDEMQERFSTQLSYKKIILVKLFQIFETNCVKYF